MDNDRGEQSYDGHRTMTPRIQIILASLIIGLVLSVVPVSAVCWLLDSRSTVPVLCPGGVFPTTCEAGVYQMGLDETGGVGGWKACHGGEEGGEFVPFLFSQITLTFQDITNAGSGSFGTFDAVNPYCVQGNTLERCLYEQGGVMQRLTRDIATQTPVAEHENIPPGLTKEIRGAGNKILTYAADARRATYDPASTLVPPAITGPPDALLCNEPEEEGSVKTQLDASAWGMTWICRNGVWEQQKGPPITKSIDGVAPTTGTSKAKFAWPVAVTLTRVWCSVDSGTVTIQLDERVEATPNTAGATNTLTAALACTTTTAATTSFADAVIAARVPHNLQITATSGSPTSVSIHLEGVPN